MLPPMPPVSAAFGQPAFGGMQQPNGLPFPQPGTWFALFVLFNFIIFFLCSVEDRDVQKVSKVFANLRKDRKLRKYEWTINLVLLNSHIRLFVRIKSLNIQQFAANISNSPFHIADFFFHPINQKYFYYYVRAVHCKFVLKWEKYMQPEALKVHPHVLVGGCLWRGLLRTYFAHLKISFTVIYQLYYYS